MNKNSGEVSAISGFDFQYAIFATELYNCLLNNEMHWVEFASSEAGKLDDVLIGMDNQIVAYQVKNIVSSTFTYSQFTVSETESILSGAFKGWIKLRETYPGLLIDARIITQQSVSEHDSITAAGGTPKPAFKSFVNNCWDRLKSGDYTLDTLPDKWVPVIEELAGLVGVNSQDFIAFVKDFSFVFEYKLDSYLHDTYTKAKRDSDIDKITKQIFRLVAQKGNVKYTRAQFINEFGLASRIETYFQHSFFIDEKHYQPIIDTTDELQNIVSNKNGGYVALVGNAGSGKSTLLTKWLSDGSYKVLRYYAYTNQDMNYGSGFRGEAEYFLHDLLVQVRESKLNLQDRLPESNLLDLQKHFYQEMHKLSLYDEKVIIIVDGLDHIEREQRVNRSLIDVLPNPKDIPKNIFFVLGTRTIEQLESINLDITFDLKNTNSIITIRPLAKTQISELLISYSLELSTDNFERLCLNTKGHPLFLRYTLEELTSSDPDKHEIIVKSNEFSGDIYTEYRKFWQKHKDYDDFIHVLGLISRFRFSYFDTRLLRLFNIKRSDASKINKVSEFYFYKSDNVWQFFHNSFKEFLIEQSALDKFNGEVDESADRSFHREIANAIENSDNEYRFNQIYHFYRANEFGSVIGLISQEYFRDQWFSYRDASIIFEDIKLASASCFHLRDLARMTACYFATFELIQRIGNFSIRDHYKIFLLIERIDIANSLVFNSSRILVSQFSALEYLILLYKIGHKETAKDLFERATPVNLLNGSTNLSARRYNSSYYNETDEINVVCTWAVAASLFLPLAEVVNKLKELKVEVEEFQIEVRNIFNEGLAKISDYYLENEDWGKLDKIADVYDDQVKPEDVFHFYFEIIESVEREHPLYKRCIEFFDRWTIHENNRINIRYLIVYTLFERKPEKCGPILTILRKPSSFGKEIGVGSDNGFSNYLLNYSRLFYIITKDFNVLPESFIPQLDKPALIAFYHIFAEIGRAYAWMYHSYTEAASGFFLAFERALEIFHYHFLDPLHDHIIANSKATLVNSVLKVSSQISSELSDSVLQKLSTEWQIYGHFWSISDIHQVVEWVIDSGLSNDWCSRELKLLELKLFRSGYLGQRLEEGLKQIELWVSLGNPSHGELLITQIMSHALDVRGEKDYQLDYILDWVSKANFIDPNEIQYYYSRIQSLYNVVNSRSHVPSTEILQLSLPFGNGFNVFSDLVLKGFVDFSDGMEIVFAYLYCALPGLKDFSLKAFTRIVLGMDGYHGNRHRFIDEFFKNGPTEEQVRTLIREIRTYSVMETRNEYLYIIQQKCLEYKVSTISVGIPRVERKKDREYSSITFRAKSGESFEEAELLEKVSELDDILSLEEQIERNSYFKWHNLVVKIIPNTNEADLESYLLNRDFDSNYLAEIACSLIDNRKENLAKKVIYLALAKSKPVGWVSFYDGGSKIRSFEQLRRIENSDVFQRVALKDFSSNITQLDLNIMESLVKDLDKLYEMFTDEVDVSVIYEQITKYKNELLRNHIPDRDAVSIKGDYSNEDLLVDLIDFLITFPSSFAEIIFPVLCQNAELLNPYIDRLLAKLFDGGFFGRYLQLVAGLSVVDCDVVSRSIGNLNFLLGHSRFDYSDLARKILIDGDLFNANIQNITPGELPLVYTLEFAPVMGVVDVNRKAVDRIDASGFLKDTDDPIANTTIFRYEIAKLSSVTGFDRYNIAYRIMQFAIDPEFPAWCKDLSEQELRSIYDSKFDLRISYRRPLIQKVISGMNQVVNELFRLGLIDYQLAKSIVGKFDKDIYAIEAISRPSSISTILTEQGSAPSADAEWAKDLDTLYLRKVLKFKYDNLFVLAEYTNICAQGHGHVSEVRQSVVDLHLLSDSNGSRVFNYVYDRLIEEYSVLDVPGIIIYNHRSTIHPKENWLAINPQLAKSMKLTLNITEGCFRWDDENGELVVQSVFWQDGSTINQNTHHNSESAEGWMVLINKEGLDRLLSLLSVKEVYMHRKIERNMSFIQRKYKTNIEESESISDTEILNLLL